MEMKGIQKETIYTAEDIVLTGDVTFKKNVRCGNITCKGGSWNIDALNIKARDINAWNIDAGNINARNIHAWDVVCEHRKKKSKENKTIARIFITGRSKLKKKEWLKEAKG